VVVERVATMPCEVLPGLTVLHLDLGLEGAHKLPTVFIPLLNHHAVLKFELKWLKF
jgi:hypothetical protein